MQAFHISRAPALTGEAPYDAFAKLVFQPPLESDELFDALRETYPGLKTHTERKKQAVLDFLMEERQAVEQEITAFVQQMGTPAPPSEVASYSTRHSPAYSAASSTHSDLRKLSTSNSSSSSSGRSAGSSPETMSLKDMTSVWTAAGHGKPKIHTRRSMTTREKEEYRRRRQMKACKECRSRKRKCNHDPSNASSAASPIDAKVKKRTSTAACSNAHPPHQSFLNNEFGATSFLADSAFSTTESPMNFLDFSPATGTDASFDDFLLLPNDDFSSMDFATDPLFQSVPQAQQFSYEPLVHVPQSQLAAPSTGSRSPSSTYQSSGMSRSGSLALLSPTQTFDTSQDFNFDLLDSTFESGSCRVQQGSLSDAKQSGLAAGLSFLIDGLTPAPTPTSPMLIPAGRRSNASASPQPTDGLQAPLVPTTRNATQTTLNSHTAAAVPGDMGRIPHGDPDWLNEGRKDNRFRQDGMVLGTDPSAGARFGEHGSSLLRGASRGVDVVANASQQGVLFRPGGHGRLESWAEAQGRAGGEATPLSSRNPTSANDPTSSSLRQVDDPASAARLRTTTTPAAATSASLLPSSSLSGSNSSEEARDKTSRRSSRRDQSSQLTSSVSSEREPSGGDDQLFTGKPASIPLSSSSPAIVVLDKSTQRSSPALPSPSSSALLPIALSALVALFVPTLLALAVVLIGAALLIASTARRDDEHEYSDGRRPNAASVSVSSPSPRSVVRAFARRVGGGWRARTTVGGGGEGKAVFSSSASSLLLYGVSRSGVLV